MLTPTLRLEVCRFELKLREINIPRDAPGLEGELLTSVHELGTGAGGFDLGKLVLITMVLMNMVMINMVLMNMVLMMLVLVNMVPRIIIITILIKTNLSLEPTGKEFSTKED